MISEVARRDVFDYLRATGIRWNGRLEEVDFLNRLYDLSSLPSGDSRFPDAGGDIWQHRVNNSMDWDDATPTYCRARTAPLWRLWTPRWQASG